jgi:hypothetical protein
MVGLKVECYITTEQEYDMERSGFSKETIKNEIEQIKNEEVSRLQLGS